MKEYEADGTEMRSLPGMAMIVYRSDGSVYFEGITGSMEAARFNWPESDRYIFERTEIPRQYGLDRDEYHFTVRADEEIVGNGTIQNYCGVTVIVSEKKRNPSDQLSGTGTESLEAGERLFMGSSNHGKVCFEITAPGKSYFKRFMALEGYELNQVIFSFKVEKDGSIVGNCAVTDRKYYKRIDTFSGIDTKRGDDEENTEERFLETEVGENDVRSAVPKSSHKEEEEAEDVSGLSGLFPAWITFIGTQIWNKFAESFVI